jgi:hypothetical protein
VEIAAVWGPERDDAKVAPLRPFPGLRQKIADGRKHRAFWPTQQSGGQAGKRNHAKAQEYFCKVQFVDLSPVARTMAMPSNPGKMAAGQSLQMLALTRRNTVVAGSGTVIRQIDELRQRLVKVMSRSAPDPAGRGAATIPSPDTRADQPTGSGIDRHAH